jgi:formylglycine-generating enzyme required for sulfatase activity
MHFPALIILLIAGLLTGRACCAPENPRSTMRSWSNANGQTVVRARFIRKEEGAIVLEAENGSQKSIPESWFSPQSLKHAAEEAEKQGDQTIAPVRAMRFVPIKRGRFTMGSPIKEPGRLTIANKNDPSQTPAADVEPERKVTITRNFWLKETEVTWTEWNAVRDRAQDYGYTDLSAGRNGYDGDPAGTHPVTDITWWDAVKWCNAKSQLEGKTPAYYITPEFKPADILTTGMPVPYVRWDASGYRLPTEAEWEYACRDGRGAGNPAFHSGQISHPGVTPLDRNLHKAAWYGGNSSGNTHPVKTKESNNFGLHDMHGNVAEWCWDWDGLLSPADAEDPRGAETGRYHIFRGGSWADPAICCRAAYRGNFSPIAPSSYLVGFRPVSGSDPQEREPETTDRPRR